MTVRRCKVCENRSMSDQVEGLRDGDAWPITSPSLIIHLTEGSGYTFCGKRCDVWERAAS
jgi:hypothetical protein